MSNESTNEKVSFSDKNRTFEVFFPKECDLDKINRVMIRGRELIEVVHGEWIHGREIAREMLCDKTICVFYENYKCSECGLILDKLLFNVDRTLFYKYCPNCGAKMDGKEQNDE